MALEVCVLGTAAGGGLPQWNCHCANCSAVRAGDLSSRSQSGVALRASGRPWVLVNASPDIARQLEVLRTAGGCEPAKSGRSAPFSAIFLTNGDLDHVLGLLQLREGAALKIIAPQAVRDGLETGLRLNHVLERYCGIDWELAADEWSTVAESGLEVRAIEIPEGGPPKYLAPANAGVHGVGYLFREIGSSKVVGVFPDVPELTESLCAAVAGCDLILFDGTFWSDRELIEIGFSERTSTQMGHVPVSGGTGSLQFLKSLSGRNRVYMHINNTNPILRPDSAERIEVEATGVRVADDGEIILL